MNAFADGRFWAGLLLGVVAYYAWLRWQQQRQTPQQ